MKCKLIVAPKARDDIIRNASWWAENHSLEQAVRRGSQDALNEAEITEVLKAID